MHIVQTVEKSVVMPSSVPIEQSAVSEDWLFLVPVFVKDYDASRY
jgi:hypothetical protein